eukprot:m.347773 g.347773  ORF g.347773 m.347773 type:complete len:523 (+) comp19870_c0_seq7:1175-2743(+)
MPATRPHWTAKSFSTFTVPQPGVRVQSGQSTTPILWRYISQRPSAEPFMSQELGNWTAQNVDMIISANSESYYPATGSGFIPGCHNASAEFYSLWLQHCALDTKQPHFYCEVANEIGVHAQELGTNFSEIIDLHIAIAERVHRDFAGQPRKRFIGGPTAAWPEWQLNNFSLWHRNMGEFIQRAGPIVDFISVHIYDHYETAGTDPLAFDPRAGSNMEAILDMQEAASALVRGGDPLPHVLSEYGSGFQDKVVPYEPFRDWFIIRGVNSKMLQMMNRPDRVLKAVPFIVNKATWWYPKHNISDPYQWVLWRKLPSGQFVPTELMKHFRFWSEFEGDFVWSRSQDANVLNAAVHNGTHLFVAAHNMRFTNQSVSFSFESGSPRTIVLKRISWNHDEQVVDLDISSLDKLPAAFTLAPSETMMLIMAVPKPANTYTTATTYAPAVAVNNSAGGPIELDVPVAQKPLPSGMALRLGLSAPNTTILADVKVGLGGVVSQGRMPGARQVHHQRQVPGRHHGAKARYQW